MRFKDWLELQEVGTSTSSVAVFSRPVGGMHTRMFAPMIVGKKRKKRKKKKMNEQEEGNAISVNPVYYKGKHQVEYEAVYNYFEDLPDGPTRRRLGLVLHTAILKPHMSSELLDWYHDLRKLKLIE